MEYNINCIFYILFLHKPPPYTEDPVLSENVLQLFWEQMKSLYTEWEKKKYLFGCKTLWIITIKLNVYISQNYDF